MTDNIRKLCVLPGMMLLRMTLLNRKAPDNAKNAPDCRPYQAFQAHRSQTSFEDDDRDADYQTYQQVRNRLKSKGMKNKTSCRDQQYKDDTYEY